MAAPGALVRGHGGAAVTVPLTSKPSTGEDHYALMRVIHAGQMKGFTLTEIAERLRLPREVVVRAVTDWLSR